MKFDPTKPVQTRKPTDWTDIEIIRTDLEGYYPIVALLTGSDGFQVPETFTLDGKLIKGKESFSDLINIPEKHVRYINFSIRGGSVYLEGMFEDSTIALNSRLVDTCACVRVEFQEGQFDE